MKIGLEWTTRVVERAIRTLIGWKGIGATWTALGTAFHNEHRIQRGLVLICISGASRATEPALHKQLAGNVQSVYIYKPSIGGCVTN